MIVFLSAYKAFESCLKKLYSFWKDEKTIVILNACLFCIRLAFLVDGRLTN